MRPEGTVGAASFSADGRCRWWLDRIWKKSRGFALFCGLNPSTASGDEDDMTVVKGMGFAERWGLGGTVHVNAFPFISTDPAGLVACTAEEIEKNEDTILEKALDPDVRVVVLMWGSFPEHRSRLWKAARILAPFSPVCLGRTRDGYPKHISRIGYDTKREPWKLSPAGVQEG